MCRYIKALFTSRCHWADNWIYVICKTCKICFYPVSYYMYFIIWISALNHLISCINFVMLNSVECPSLAYHRRAVISSWSAYISKFVEGRIFKVGALHGWGCPWNCQVRFLHPIQLLDYLQAFKDYKSLRSSIYLSQTSKT